MADLTPERIAEMLDRVADGSSAQTMDDQHRLRAMSRWLRRLKRLEGPASVAYVLTDEKGEGDGD